MSEFHDIPKKYVQLPMNIYLAMVECYLMGDTSKQLCIEEWVRGKYEREYRHATYSLDDQKRRRDDGVTTSKGDS